MPAVDHSELIEGAWDFTCPVDRCGFTSVGWATKRLATERAEQHANEHETGEPTPELADFQNKDEA